MKVLGDGKGIVMKLLMIMLKGITIERIFVNLLKEEINESHGFQFKMTNLAGDHYMETIVIDHHLMGALRKLFLKGIKTKNKL